jgi:hypothetical protein
MTISKPSEIPSNTLGGMVSAGPAMGLLVGFQLGMVSIVVRLKGETLRHYHLRPNAGVQMDLLCIYPETGDKGV